MLTEAAIRAKVRQKPGLRDSLPQTAERPDYCRLLMPLLVQAALGEASLELLEPPAWSLD